MKIKERLHRLLPAYTYLPMAALLLLHFLTYFVTKPITANFRHYSVTLPIDGMIPFVPAFSVIYVLAFLQWGIGLVSVAKESRELCYRYLSGEMIAKFICLAIFLLLPTTMTRPEITGSDLFSRVVRLIYCVDIPVNLFPSLHCLESWICFRGTLRLKRAGKGAKIASLVFTLLVFASTVFIKQHLVLDILGGVAVCEIGLLLSRLTRADRLLRWLNRPFDKEAR